MRRRCITIEGGRYLCFYTFDSGAATLEPGGSRLPEAKAEIAPTDSQPVADEGTTESNRV